MAQWLLFGAGGKGVGNMIVQLAIANQQQLVAVVRNTEAVEKLSLQGVRVFVGDACDKAIVTAACEAAGAGATVISTMGARKTIWQTVPLLIVQSKRGSPGWY